MANLTLVTQPAVWVYFVILGTIIIITTGKALKYEYAKRKSKKTETKFVSKITEFSSLACLISCPLYGLSLMVFNRLNMFCFVGQQTTFMFWFFQFCFMALYQISVLQDWSSKSNKTGYPKFPIYMMYTIHSLAIINCVICPWFFINVPLKCGCDEYVCSATYNLSMFHERYAQWAGFFACFVIFCDFMTLVIYIITVDKLKNQFKTTQPSVYDRIMAIMCRRLLLTIFYQVIGFITVFTHMHYIIVPTPFALILDGTLNGLLCIALSYAMFFMQQHNAEEYKKFLKVLHALKFQNCLCLCFRLGIKNDVLLYLMKEMDGVINDSQTTEPDTLEETVIDTDDESVQKEHTQMTQVSIVSQAH